MIIEVPITGTDHHQDVYDTWCGNHSQVGYLDLERDPGNPYDDYAVKVLYGGRQMGWVGKEFSRFVARELDAGGRLKDAQLVYNRPGYSGMNRLLVRLKIEGAAKSPAVTPLHTVKVVGALSQMPDMIRHLRNASVGTVFACSSTAGRTSVSLIHPQHGECAWFRKEEPGAMLLDSIIHDINRGFAAARVETQNPLTLGLYRKADLPELTSAFADAVSKINGGYITDDKIRVGSLTSIGTIGALNTSTLTKSTTPKETTMNNFFSRILSINSKAAGDAAYLETGRIANATVVKMITARLPFMARFYAKTPFGKLATANAAIALVQQLRPNDQRLQRLATAMATSAYQEVYQLVDIEGAIDELMATPAIKRALDNLEMKSGEATPL